MTVALLIGAVTMPFDVALSATYLFDVLAKPAHHKAWDALFLGEKNVDSWLTQYSKTRNGPSTPGKTVELEGVRYQLHNICKAHSCGDNMFYVLFGLDGAQAWGLLLKRGQGERFFGAPDDEKKDALRIAGRD